MAPLALAVPSHASVAFKNCTEAYDAGFSNIPEGDSHYAPRLDKDDDGWGCDARVLANDGKAKTGVYASADEPTPTSSVTGPAEPSEPARDLAETGGSQATPYVIATAALLLAGGGYLALHRRRQD